MNSETMMMKVLQDDMKETLEKSFWAGYNAGIKVAAQIAHKSEYKHWFEVASFAEPEFKPQVSSDILGALHE